MPYFSSKPPIKINIIVTTPERLSNYINLLFKDDKEQEMIENNKKKKKRRAT
jgi:hypothetical protein